MNTLVDHIYVINLESRPNRLAAFDTRFADIDYELFKAVDPAGNPFYAAQFANWMRRHNLDGEFNAPQYLENNPDLRRAGIRTSAAALRHWKNYGEAEGRVWGKNTDMMRPGQWGCLCSHIGVLRDAIQCNYKSILIMEDDCVPVNPTIFESGLACARSYMASHPEWTVLYLGAAQDDWAHIPDKSLEAGWYNAQNTRGTFAYMVNKSFMQYLLSEYEREDSTSDGCMKRLQGTHGFQFPVLFPNIVWCYLEESDTGPSRSTTEWRERFRWVGCS
jgi:hypothetical protein